MSNNINKEDYLSNNKEDIFENELRRNNLFELFTDGYEALLDSCLEDGLTKELPFVGTVIKLINVGFTVKDRFTAKKLLTFLYNIKDIPREKRIDFLEKLEENDHFKQEATTTLLNSLDRFDHLHKATMLGRLLVAFVEDKISIEQFSRFSFIIEKVYLNDLTHLKNFSAGNKKEYNSLIAESLSRDGLLKLASIDGLTWDAGVEINENDYAITELGLKLLTLNIIEV